MKCYILYVENNWYYATATLTESGADMKIRQFATFTLLSKYVKENNLPTSTAELHDNSLEHLIKQLWN